MRQHCRRKNRLIQVLKTHNLPRSLLVNVWGGAFYTDYPNYARYMQKSADQSMSLAQYKTCVAVYINLNLNTVHLKTLHRVNSVHLAYGKRFACLDNWLSDSVLEGGEPYNAKV